MDKGTPSFIEDHISQIPALQVLVNLGYKYISPQAALHLRGDKSSNVILESILEDRLRNMSCNSFVSGGQTYQFSNANIQEAINTLKKVPNDGLIKTNEKVYDLISMPKSFEETLPTGKKSFGLNYIDWENISDNVFHVTEEYSVETANYKEHRRPDIVLFVNGIPLCVIECKRPDMKQPLEQAISQQIRNQAKEEIPNLFIYSQMLLALSVNEAMYATAGTPRKFWSKWKERNLNEAELHKLINTPLNSDIKKELFKDRDKAERDYFDNLEKSERQVTQQDISLYCLCRPERLLDITRFFVVYDVPDKKIARHQQYFVIKSAVNRVKEYEEGKKRRGGVIWHTQGSGKSLTMVMLSKALAMEKSIPNARVIVVTDRINLDKQIRDTFHHCGITANRAKSGTDLLELLENEKNTVMTTVLFKFRSAVRKSKKEISTENVFILADEGHRSHYGAARGMLEKMLPGACYIGFTGTPLMKDEKKSTMSKFGGFIDPTYTLEEATQDGAVVRLIYEGRYNILKVNEEPLDTWMARETEGLPYGQQADLKREFVSKSKLMGIEDNIKAIAYDISEHYSKNWQGTGFKAQLAVWSKADALKFKKHLDSFGKVTSEVVISAPDDREGYEEVDDEPTDEVRKFWNKMMEKYGDDEKYEEQIVRQFKDGDEPEILIVVSKLLTGFDAPRNTVLYLAKCLKDHSLLQAIARVNRLYDGKEFGYVIDYAGILGELDKALTLYKALDGFEDNDLKGMLKGMKEEIRQLPEDYTNLMNIFAGIKNKQDAEEYERLLADEELRDKFYDKLSKFSLRMGIALSSRVFYDTFNEETINKYKGDLKAFQNLRRSVKRRYSDMLDMKEYEPKIKKILDTYVTAGDMVQITEPVDIFDKIKFKESVEKVEGKAAKADTIAYNTRRTIHDKFDEDPVFFEKFSKLLQNAIDAFRQERLTDAQYLNAVMDIASTIVDKKNDDLPVKVRPNENACAIYRVIADVLKEVAKDTGLLADASIAIDKIIKQNAIVEWQLNDDAKNRMINEIEDYMADEVKADFDMIDLIIEKIMKLANVRYAR